MKYKVGDKVRINSLDWYNEKKDDCGVVLVENGNYMFCKSDTEWCSKIVTIKEVCFDEYYRIVEDFCKYRWTDEMIEGLVEEETPKFKVNDIVFVKNVGWVRITNSYWDSLANEYIYEAIGFDGKGEYDSINQSNIECLMLPESENPHTGGNKITLDDYKNNDKEWLFNKLAMLDNITALESIQDIFNHLQQPKHPKTYEECCDVLEYIPHTDDMIEGLVEEEIKSENELLDEYEELTDRAFKGGYEKCKSDIKLNGFQLPDGYQFVDENGNVINATKIVLEKNKKEFPKTYEECCKVLGTYSYNQSIVGYKNELFSALQKLIICRDAYWKIAGEEMGLGKPWEPDYNDLMSISYGLYNELKYSIINPAQFLFPTKEMRDAFYENFKNEIEQCKELCKMVLQDYCDFISLVKRMREAQKDVIYKSMFSTLDSSSPTAYEAAKMKQIVLEQEVDEYLKKLEEKS